MQVLDQDYLNSLFRYEAGQLYWKDTTVKGPGRPRSKGPLGHPGQKGHLSFPLPGGRRVKVSRVIWVMHFGPIPEGYEVDHINRVTHDDRLSNLRLATSSEQKCNRRRVHRSGVPPKYPRNVCCTNGRYFAKVYKNKRCHLGPMRDTPEQAANDAASLRKMWHGEFATHCN